jgi:hypothetical protein
MAALTDLSDIINRLTGGNSGTPEIVNVYIDNRAAGAAATATVAGRLTSLWQYQKMPGGEGAAPTTSAIPVNDTPGAFFQTDPGGGRDKWLLGVVGHSSQGGTLTIYDRLVHQGGLSGTATGEQTTNLPTTALTRYSGTASVGNFIGIEIYGQIGTTARTITVNYTNQAGTPTRTTKAIDIGATGLREAQRIFICPLQDGDTGVRSIGGVTLSGTTGTAGNFGVFIGHPIISIPMPTAGIATVRDLITGLPSVMQVLTDACLSAYWMPNATTAPQINLQLSMIEA